MIEAKELLAEVVGLELLLFPSVTFSDVPETGNTFLDNAILKAKAISLETGLPVLSEDSGLEVYALNGAPGARSARYAGEPSNTERNNALLLKEMDGKTDRRAHFITVAVLCLQDGQLFATSGVYPGTIGHECLGDMGFGYDPLFIPKGETRTLAQMTLEEKNAASHRQKALSRMVGILQDLAKTGELSTSAIQ